MKTNEFDERITKLEERIEDIFLMCVWIEAYLKKGVGNGQLLHCGSQRADDMAGRVD